MGIRDTFTKEEQQEDVLNYDDSAFYYFASCILLCIAVPWTFRFVYNIIFPGGDADKSYPKKNRNGNAVRYCKTAAMVEKVDKARKEARQCSSSAFLRILMQAAFIAAFWGVIAWMILQVSEHEDIKSFDPFAILDVAPGSEDSDIKKAYRKLSLVYHPDKNPDDPSAASKFIQITKAYQSLTDPAAKANYEKYGNPDGPTTSKVGIGLPHFLLEKENHLMILCSFFAMLIIVIPTVFICYYQRTMHYAPSGVLIETLQFLSYYMNEATRVKNCPELFAASAESRSMMIRPSDNQGMVPIMNQAIEHKKRQFAVPIITKNQFLIWAHMQRLHHLFTDDLQKDCDQLLRYSVKITQAMIEMACMREWFFTAQAMIEFRRCLIQALDVKSSSLLQIPHFNEDILRHCSRGKNSVSGLSDFLSKDPSERKGTADMDAQQLQDIEAFTTHMSDVELKGAVEVEDEDEIVVGDVCTVIATLIRKNLKEGECLGPVHAPLFPEPKLEEWWVFLVESTSSKIIAFEKIKATDRVVEEKLRFQVGKAGKHTFSLHAMCDAYAGIDKKVDIIFNALEEEAVKREIVLHKEDEDLDLQPTLFQQFMGELNHEEESEEEEEGEKRPKKKKAKKEDESKDEEGKEKKGKGKAKKDKEKKDEEDDDGSDSDSDSSSGSDSDGSKSD